MDAPPRQNARFRTRRRWRRWLAAAAAAPLGLLATSPDAAWAQAPVAEQAPVAAADAPAAYRVSAIELRYAQPHPQHPPVPQLLELRVSLVAVAGQWAAPAVSEAPERILSRRLADVGAAQPVLLRPSAVEAISRAVVSELNRRDLVGVFVEPEAIGSHGEDLRGGDSVLRLVIFTAVVDQVDAAAAPPGAGRVAPADTQLRRVAARSPLRGARDDQPGDLLRKSALEDYLARLNRHPGRRVEAAITPGDEAGQINLEYLVALSKPWLAYAQIANTGTEQTSKWRQRFGVIHNQLTGRDDIFSLDYATARFDDTHSVVGSYEAPLPASQRLRGRVFGSWNQFTASDVGLDVGGGGGADFRGESWTTGGELIVNLFQQRELFIDMLVGVRWWNVHVDSRTGGLRTSERQDFFLPHVGVRMERNRDLSSLWGSLTLEWNWADLAGTSDTRIERLGRLPVEDDWVVLEWDLGTSFYLEPLLSPQTHRQRQGTLAHELVLLTRGQYAFDDRLIPQAQQVAGGLYSVRGYDEALAAGDSVAIGSVEYRFHLPRTLTPRQEPGTLLGRPFRYAPAQPQGRADWDLIFRTFVDVGRTVQHDRLSIESNETLVGAGAGVELLLKRHLSLRADWGVALRSAENNDAGDNRFHFVGTILW